jgi:hypothetical protein
MDATTARRHNVTRLVTEAGGPTAFGLLVNREQVQVSQWISDRKPKPIGHRLARHIELSLGLDRGWLDTDHSRSALPITPRKAAALNPQVLATLARSLHKAYALSGRTFILEDEPERFANLYQIAIDALASGEVVAPDNMVKLLLMQDAQQHGGSSDRRRHTGSTGVPSRSKNQGTGRNRGAKR